MLSFVQTILQSKKAMPRPSKKLLEEAAQKSFLTMTTEKEQQDSCEYNGIIVTKEDVQSEIRRTVVELFSDFTVSLNDLSQATFPSVSANYVNSRSKFGTFKSLDDLYKKVPIKVEEKLVNSYYPVANGDYGFADENMSILRADVDQEDIMLKNIPTLQISVDGTRSLYWHALAAALEEEPVVKPVPLAEPLKVRVISKGPPLTYHVLKPFQKLILKRLQKWKQFMYTGEPVTSQSMDLFAQIYHRFGGKDKRGRDLYWHSGDYSRATDELHSWASEEACNAFFDTVHIEGGSKEVFRTLMLRALTGHIYENPEDSKDLREQKRGQLMGSIISFPFLCILNITLIRMAYELSLVSYSYKGFHNMPVKPFVSLRRLPTRINGDDCLTIVSKPESFNTWWSSIGDIMGLSESIGKTYLAKDWGTINSRFFSFRDGSTIMVPFIHLGGLYGMKRSSSESSPVDKEVYELTDCIEDVIADAPLEFRNRVLKRFLYLHARRLREWQVSWFLPTWLGGLGIPTLDEISDMDLRRAYAIRQKLASGIVVPKAPTDSSWQIYREVDKYLKGKNPFHHKIMSYTMYKYDDYERKGSDPWDEPNNHIVPIVYHLWKTRGFRSLYGPQTKSCKTFKKKLEQFSRVVLTHKRLDPRELTKETRKYRVPVQVIET
jgi:hypothetical protein